MARRPRPEGDWVELAPEQSEGEKSTDPTPRFESDQANQGKGVAAVGDIDCENKAEGSPSEPPSRELEEAKLEEGSFWALLFRAGYTVW